MKPAILLLWFFSGILGDPIRNATFYLFPTFGDEDAEESKIFGGEPAPIRSHPHQVSLQLMPGNYHGCGGSLISADRVATAAHCFRRIDVRRLRVVAGANNVKTNESSQQVRYIKDVVLHPQVDLPDYDYAVIHLDSPFELNDMVNVIKLAPTDFEPSGPCLSSGWGHRSDTNSISSQLMQVRLTLVPLQTCNRNYVNGFLHYITNRMLCAGEKGKGACTGDSGGPLVCDGYLAGIVSWGNQPCAQEGFPTVFSKVSREHDWLETA